MPYNKPYIQRSDPFRNVLDTGNDVRNIYYGEVISTDDPTDGGAIKVKILGLDNRITDHSELPDCYPLLPKFFHVYPQIGEIVRVFIENTNFPQRGRFWLGSVISQPQKIGFDSIYTALSTTNMGLTSPEPAPSTYPDAIGVFPTKEDVAIVGKENTDIILRDKQLEFRAGKHENGEILKLNIENPATLSLTFEQIPESENYYSNSVMLSDKIAIISHEGVPKFKAARVTPEERARMFEQGHPLGRGDLIVEAFNLIRRAIISHIHGYSALPADKDTIINDLENINFESILQKNIVIN